MITIYTTPTCSRCKILKKKLDIAGIPFQECGDIEIMTQLGIAGNFMPMVQIQTGAPIMTFEETLEWMRKESHG